MINSNTITKEELIKLLGQNVYHGVISLAVTHCLNVPLLVERKLLIGSPFDSTNDLWYKVNVEEPGHLPETECFLNTHSGDIMIINWISNRPKDTDGWVKIDKLAYDNLTKAIFK